MHKAIGYVLLTGVAIIATGVFLNEADKGTFGGWIQGIAKMATNGFATTQA